VNAEDFFCNLGMMVNVSLKNKNSFRCNYAEELISNTVVFPFQHRYFRGIMDSDK